ncbi:uncharacterized protein LOC123701202 [Colias croceus]|uniref:uncharacterized protein LOC123701202 n=1 Tax=Colias crocea TaxID=72248 RepID=UPI001E27DBE3|nr:uncharacterized protein LOC123701202 [Colias croceus]
MINQKQLKITKLFRKGATKVPEDCEEIQQRIQELEEKLRSKQEELFQIQRHAFKRKASPPKPKKDAFVKPHKIGINTAVETMKRNIELMSLLTGVEIQSYVMHEHCCIVYHMQHPSEHQIKHGLRIEMKSGGKEVTNSSLPIGFNLDAIIKEYNNVMMPDCLNAIKKALLAYYDRLEQYEALKNLLKVDGKLFKTLDSSHMEIAFFAQSDAEEQDEQLPVTLILDYRVCDIRPKSISFKEVDLPEDVSETLREQCITLYKKPLHRAFKDIFVNGVGTYRLVQQLGPRRETVQVRNKRFRPNKRNYNNDDTFLPEDCSDQGEEECVE